MKSNWMVVVMVSLVGCGGQPFAGSPDDLVVPDANLGADSEVDAVTGSDTNRADMVGQGDAPGTTEASVDGGAPDVRSDSEEDGSTVPTCPEEEVYPQASPTCAKWIATTPWPLERACCRKETHTCGHVVTFTPFCVELH